MTTDIRIVIPSAGRFTLYGVPVLADLRAQIRPLRVLPRLGPDGGWEINRTKAHEVAWALAQTNEVRIDWSVTPGTGTCTRRCWNARRFLCSCTCAGKRHGPRFSWIELRPRWLTTTIGPAWVAQVEADMAAAA